MKTVIRHWLSVYLTCFAFWGLGQNGNTTYTAKLAKPGIDTTHQTENGLKTFDQSNFYQLIAPTTYNKTIASAAVPLSYQSNPDFGFMPYGSPLENVFEELGRRTSDERYFRDSENPSVFYLQKSSAPINYFKDNNWLSIDPRLKKVDAQHYQAAQQPLVCGLDVVEKKTTMYDGNNVFGFNHFSLMEYDQSGNASFYKANWQQYTVGDNGIFIQNIFPDIDLILQFSEHSVKSNFVLHHARTGSSRLVFVDSLDLPHGYNVSTYSGNVEQKGFSGSLTINDATGHSQYVYGVIHIDDAIYSNLGAKGYYSVSGNAVMMSVYSDVFNNPQISYPLTIDPLVTYGAYNSAVNPTGAGTSPIFCSNGITVAVPGGATYTGCSATASITNTDNTCGCGAGQNCRLNKDQLYITSSCGGASPVGAPGIIWGCLVGCNVFGTWNPAFGFGSSGMSSLATCIPPSCAAQNINFRLFLNQWGCGGANCGSCVYAANTCSHLNSWSVTLQGHTLELLGNVAGSGTSSVSGNCNVNTTLNPSALYGVPGYTYSWSPGGSTSSTLTVNQSANGAFTYTATVTDACGVAQTATFTFNIADCPLPVELTNFDAKYNGKTVDVKWSTATETNNDYFTVERTTNGIIYSAMGIVQSLAPGGNSITALSYSLNDATVETGIYYYQLKQTDLNGDYKYSAIVPVSIGDEDATFVVTPNPAKNTIDLFYEADGTTSILKIADAMGKEIYEEQMENTTGKQKHTITISKFPTGIYFIVLTMSTKTQGVKLVKQ